MHYIASLIGKPSATRGEFTNEIDLLWDVIISPSGLYNPQASPAAKIPGFQAASDLKVILLNEILRLIWLLEGYNGIKGNINPT